MSGQRHTCSKCHRRRKAWWYSDYGVTKYQSRTKGGPPHLRMGPGTFTAWTVLGYVFRRAGWFCKPCGLDEFRWWAP